jgi:hypothetical protein
MMNFLLQFSLHKKIKKAQTVPFLFLPSRNGYESIILVFVIIVIMLVVATMTPIITVLVLAVTMACFSIATYSGTGCATNGSTNNGTIAAADNLRAYRSTGTAADCTAQCIISQMPIASAARQQQEPQNKQIFHAPCPLS